MVNYTAAGVRLITEKASEDIQNRLGRLPSHSRDEANAVVRDEAAARALKVYQAICEDWELADGAADLIEALDELLEGKSDVARAG